jgi:hypothetical protein
MPCYVRCRLPRVQPALRLLGTRNILTGSNNFVRNSHHQLPRMTVRHCSSSSNKDAADMASNHLEESHSRIFENNRKWAASMTAEDPEFFDKLSSGQSPEYLYASIL